METTEFLQKRWRYMIAAMILALFSGIGYAWSVFQGPVMKNFDWHLEAISLTFTIQVLTSTVSPVFLGRFQQKLGVASYLRVGIAVYALGLLGTMFTRSIGYFYIVFGLIVGVGLGMLYPCLMSYSTRLFPEKTGLASGLLACSYGSGAVLWAPTATYLMNSYGTLTVFGIFAGLFAAVMLPISFVLKEVPENFAQAMKLGDKKKSAQTARDHTWKEMLKTSSFYILVLALTIGATSGLMITGHASNIMQETIGASAERAAVLVGMISIFNAFGRLVFGTLSDKIGRYNMMMCLFFLIACAMLLLTMTDGVLFIGSLFAIGAGYGGFTSMISPLCADVFGIKHLAVNYSWFYISYGIAGVVGPQLASIIRTSSGGYSAAFLTVAGMSIFGIVIIFLQKARTAEKKIVNDSV